VADLTEHLNTFNSIANGVWVRGGAGDVFYCPGRKGHPFMMNNNAIYMPAYDSSPNLTALRIQYNVQQKPAGCPAP
jgi:hypothetical protein